MLLRYLLIDPPRRGDICFTDAAELPLHIIRGSVAPFRGKACHETGEPHQVDDAKERPPLSHEDFRIRGREVCPLRGNGANGGICDAQQESLAVAVVALAYADEPLSAERVEGMGDAHKVRWSVRSGCISSCVTSVWSGAGSSRTGLGSAPGSSTGRG